MYGVLEMWRSVADWFHRARTMPRPVFISYVRSASAADAQALANRLGHLAFLDTETIDDGDHFPQRLLDGVLDAKVVVIFATKMYLERRFCRLEMRLALAGGDAAAPQVVVALGDGGGAVLDFLPAEVANESWPVANEADRLEVLVRKRLTSVSGFVRDRLRVTEAQRLAEAFLEESKVPPPQSLQGITCSIPEGVASQSIGTRFVGRSNDLRKIHRALSEGSGGGAQLTSRIAAGAGFGKTRLAVEYLYRYGPTHYPGGLFWLDGGSKALDVEFHRVLRALEPTVSDLAAMRAQNRDVRQELGAALRGIGRPALYVVDNIPEPVAGEDPPTIQKFCPALGAVTVLSTSRQNTREANVQPISVDVLAPDAATLLLTDNVPGAGVLTWQEWGRIAQWVDFHPLALDLLNRSLLFQSISARALLQKSRTAGPRTPQLDLLREALRGQVPSDAALRITEAFSISFEKLSQSGQQLACVLAQLGSVPIPHEFVDALPEKFNDPRAKVAVSSRHFITFGDASSFGVMHHLTADFLRGLTTTSQPLLIAIEALSTVIVMTTERCRDPRCWPLMNSCRLHAEELFIRCVAIDAKVVEASLMGALAGWLASNQGDHARARQLQERVLELARRVLGEEHPDTLILMKSLARTLAAQGDYAGARELQVQVLEVRRRVLGEEHPDTLTSMDNLANTLAEQGNHAGAQLLQEHVLKERRRVLGEEHPDTLTAMNNLANTLAAQGDYAEAQQLQERALEAQRRVLGEEHPVTLTSMNNLANTLAEQGDHARARQLQERVLELARRVLGEEHPDTLIVMNNLATILAWQGNHVGAQLLQVQVLEARRRVLGDEHPDTLTSMDNLASTLAEQGDYAGARQLQERLLKVRRRVLGEEHPDTLTAMNNLASTLAILGDHVPARWLQ